MKSNTNPIETFWQSPSCTTVLNFVLGKITLKKAIGGWSRYPLNVDDCLPKDYTIDDFQQIYDKFISNHTYYHIEYSEQNPDQANKLVDFLERASDFLNYIKFFIHGYKLGLEISDKSDAENAFQILKGYLPPNITKENFEKLYSNSWIDDKINVIEYISRFAVY